MPPNVLRPYAPIVEVVETLLRANIAGLATVDGVEHTGTAFPTDLEDRLPFVRVDRIGGPQQRLNEYPTLDIDGFYSTYAQAVSLSEAISTLLLDYPHAVVLESGRKVVLDEVSQDAPATERPWDDSNIRRFMATYSFSVRR